MGLTEPCRAVEVKGPINVYVDAHYKTKKKPDSDNNPDAQIQALFALALSLSTLVFTVCVVDLTIIGDFPTGSRETEHFEGIQRDDLDGLAHRN